MQAFLTALVEQMAGTPPTQRLRLSFAQSLPPLPADPDRLERVLVNLLGNALKYSDAPAEVLVHSSCAGGFVAIVITDRGVGIPRQELPHVFERCCRGKNGGRQDGLGLGLYITALLVRAHGGRIEVESELGKGSVFRVFFPVDGGTAGPAA
jgi:signal transduction histidine kinase